MNYLQIMSLNQDEFQLLRKINNGSKISQRELAKNLGFSLGKLNYCLKNLVEKGLVKLNNFKGSDNKMNYIYLLTPKGMSEKVNQTINFMNQKMKEYDELRLEALYLKKKLKKKERK